MTTYTLTSIKHTETMTGTLREAIIRARAIDEDYQPAFGVTVSVGDRTLLETGHADDDAISALRDEAAMAGDDVQVDLCDRALTGDDEEARVSCLVAIAEAAAQ